MHLLKLFMKSTLWVLKIRSSDFGAVYIICIILPFCKNDKANNIIRASDGENIIIYFKSADKIRKVSLLDIIDSGGVNISFRNKESNTPDWLVSETELQALADEENGSFKCNSQH